MSLPMPKTSELGLGIIIKDTATVIFCTDRFCPCDGDDIMKIGPEVTYLNLTHLDRAVYVHLRNVREAYKDPS